MKTKDALNEIVNELEQTGALVSTLQGILLSKGHISEEEVAKAFPRILRNSQNRLAALHVAISQLPE